MNNKLRGARARLAFHFVNLSPTQLWCAVLCDVLLTGAIVALIVKVVQ